LAYEFARYLKVRGAWGAGWSPDGRRVSFLTEITGVPQVWEVASEGPSWPEQLTFYEERVSYAAYSPAKAGLVFGMDVGGNERSQLFLLRDGEVTDLTNAPDAIHYPGGFSPDGRRIAYTATRRNGTDFDVFIQDVPDGEPETVWEVSGYHTVADWAPDGRYLIVSRHHSNVNNDLYGLDLQTGEARLLTLHEGDARFSGANVTPDGENVFLATDRDGEFLRLARLDLATSDLHYFTPDDWDVEGIELSKDGRYLVVGRNVDGYSDVLLFNGRGTRMPDPEMPEGIVGGFEFSPDSKRLAFTLTAPERNPDVWVLDLPDGEARRLTRSSTAGIPPRTFRKPRVVRYKSFDGREIPALFHEPEKENAPVIINVHGGPESQARPAFAPVTQYLLNRGYAVFFPNVRGSTGYGKEYTHLDDVRLRMDSVRDLTPRTGSGSVRTGGSPSWAVLTAGSWCSLRSRSIRISGRLVWTSLASPTSSPSWRTRAATVALCASPSTARWRETTSSWSPSARFIKPKTSPRRSWSSTARTTLGCLWGRRSR
jgi:dipeptidyl aminopeptidase/acylaminoacyl peptidase